jgi:polyferredoxin
MLMDDLERLQQKLIKRNETQTKPKKKKIDRIVRGVLIYWVVFVAVSWITFWIKDSIPDTLVTAGLGGGAVELLITGAIEIFRDKMNKEEK